MNYNSDNRRRGGCNNCSQHSYSELPSQYRQARDAGAPDCGYYRIDDNGMELARAYVLRQRYENVYDVREAFCRGTAFEDLDKPCW